MLHACKLIFVCVAFYQFFVINFLSELINYEVYSLCFGGLLIKFKNLFKIKAVLLNPDDMKKLLLLFIFFFCVTIGSAQDKIYMGATVVDVETNEPIPYVNIGFFEQGIGTVSDDEGHFKLSYSEKELKKFPSLQFSSIGYETLEIAFKEIQDLSSYKVLVYLTPKENDLDEIVLKTTKRNFEKLGSSVYAKREMGYWRNKEGLGGEIATRITVDHKNTQLHSLTFNIQENLSDSLLVRVKVYDYNRGFPGNNLLTENIFHMVSKKKGEETIPLKEHRIVVDEDIIVSLELVEIYGDAIYFAVSASPYSGNSYTRKLSQDFWKNYPDTRVSFNLISSFPDPTYRTFVKVRQAPEKIKLYWDTSTSMKKRDAKEELKLLKKYLRSIQNVEVEVSKFNTSIYETKTFRIKNGRVSQLIDFLENSLYHGASSFEDILKQDDFKADTTLLFSDGATFLEPLQPEVNTQIFTINSLAKANHVQLQQMAYFNNGHYINLHRVDANEGVTYMKNELDDAVKYNAPRTKSRDDVYGAIYNDQGPVQGAIVMVKDSFVFSETDAGGNYTIPAGKGDVLTIRSLGMLDKDTVVGVLKKMHIPMKPANEELGEVLLKKTNTREIADALVKTPYGMKKRGGVGYSLSNTMTSEEIKSTDVYLHQLIMKMRGIQVLGMTGMAGQDPVYVIRKNNRNSITLNGGLTLPAIIIDDMAFDQMSGQKLPPVNVQLIERITVLSTAQSINRYGQIAAYGAIVVEMKKDFDRNKLTKSKPKVDLTVKGNDYIEAVETLENDVAQQNKPYYLEALTQTTSFQEAKEIYQKQLQTAFAKSISYYIAVSNYFKKWDREFAIEVLSTIAEIAPTNPKALKSLAYHLDSLGAYEQSILVYQHIVSLQPEKAQSYLDAALAYKNVADYKKAAALYTQMLYNTIPNLDFTGVKDIVVHELRDIVTNHKTSLEYTDLPEELLQVGFKQDTRIVFEWNDPLSEFDIQFVNPNNKFFTFKHTSFENSDLIQQEIADGFSTKEFVLEDPSPGKWLINIVSHSKKNRNNPIYVKYVVYKDFGQASQTKSVKIIDISTHQKKVTLDTFSNL